MQKHLITPRHEKKKIRNHAPGYPHKMLPASPPAGGCYQTPSCFDLPPWRRQIDYLDVSEWVENWGKRRESR